jgi:hypothetical protein
MLFSDKCKKITLTKESDLEEIINYLKDFTFEKNDDVTVHEFFSLYIFLIASFKISKINLPVEVLKDESPEFRLSRISKAPYLGLEHTRATIEKYKMDMSELQKYPPGTVVETSFYSPTKKLPKKSSVGIKEPGQALNGSGYGDNQVEEEWSDIMLDSIERKTQLLNQKHFEKYRTNELLIEDDSPVDFFVDINEGIKILRGKYYETKFKEPLRYDRIHVISKRNVLIYDVFGETIKVDVRKSQLSKK